MNPTRPLLILLFILTFFTSAPAQTNPLAAPNLQPIDLYPEGLPANTPLPPNMPPEHYEKGRIFSVSKPTLTPFPAQDPNGTAIILCAGGGYARIAINSETPDLVHWLNSLGINAFVLKYRGQEFGHPAPLQDILRAHRILRAHAADYQINPTRIGVLGASSGGHLAACTATLFNSPEGNTNNPLDATSARPDFLILEYPLISLAPPYQGNSLKALLGPHPTPEAIDHLSPHKQVTKESSPTFLVHTADDTDCPVQNSLLFYHALQTAHVPAELHLYEQGHHGFGLALNKGPLSNWPLLCQSWLQSHNFLPPNTQPPTTPPDRAFTAPITTV